MFMLAWAIPQIAQGSIHSSVLLQQRVPIRPDVVDPTWLIVGLIVLLILAIISIVVAWIVSSSRAKQALEPQLKAATANQTESVRLAELEAHRIIEAAQTQQKQIILDAKDEMLKIRERIEVEARERRSEAQREAQRIETRLQQKEENIDNKQELLEKRDKAIQQKEREAERLRAEAEELKNTQATELERVANLTADEAKAELLAQVEQDTRADAARRIRMVEAEAKEDADGRVRRILAIAAARCASDYVAEITVTSVPLPSEEMKGRIIGREGRNIRAIEQATGVDLIIDDTPDAVTLSGFDPIRREIARRALTKLIQDGRIHPARIEELVLKAEQEVETNMREEGERAAIETGVQGLHPDIIKLLGRLRYRYSYGQNVLQHSIETSIIAGTIAAEMGADVNVAKTAGFLHDIGKAVDHQVEGPHALIGADIAKRLGRSPKIVHAIAAHHADEEPQTVEAWIVIAADAISGARPGARRESVDNYIKRLEALETVANSFDCVERAFAIQAGREVRILVKPDGIDDLGMAHLARDVVKKIEDSLDYPGQIKVTVIREIRAIDYAR